MSVSPIQRVSAILILIAVIIWFFNTTLIRTLPREPLILSGEWVIRSQNPEGDSYFFQEILKMEKPALLRISNEDYYSFKKGFLITEGLPGADTLIMRVSNMDRVWQEILASPVRIVSPPEKKQNARVASFILPGGQYVTLKEQ